MGVVHSSAAESWYALSVVADDDHTRGEPPQEQRLNADLARLIHDADVEQIRLGRDHLDYPVDRHDPGGHCGPRHCHRGSGRGPPLSRVGADALADPGDRESERLELGALFLRHPLLTAPPSVRRGELSGHLTQALSGLDQSCIQRLFGAGRFTALDKVRGPRPRQGGANSAP